MLMVPFDNRLYTIIYRHMDGSTAEFSLQCKFECAEAIAFMLDGAILDDASLYLYVPARCASSVLAAAITSDIMLKEVTASASAELHAQADHE